MKDLETAGVRLVAATFAMLDVEETSGFALASLIGVAPPPQWPPLYNGPETRAWIREHLADPVNAGWPSWYVIADVDGVPTLAGIAGYKAAPDADAMVEIGYSIVPALQRRGIATAAVKLLSAHAFDTGEVSTVTAQTLPDLVASQGVLRRAGFARARTFHDPEAGEVWEYRLDHP